MTENDTEAPYGRHPDGTPKRSNGGRPKGTGGRPTGKAGRTTQRPRAAAAPKRKTTPNTAPKAQAEHPDYRPSFSMAAGFIGAGIASTAPLDGYVILTSADDLGTALNDLAGINKYVRQLGDRMMQVGPYAGLVSVLQRIGAQICENHGWIPTNLATKLGAVPRGQLIAHIRSEQAFQEAQSRAAEQAAAAMNFTTTDSADPYPAESEAGQATQAPFTRTDYAAV